MITHLDNELWQYALRVYKIDEVKACLHILQDEFGFNMNVIIGALFSAVQSKETKLSFYQLMANDIACFEDACRQARELRRNLKLGSADVYQQAKQHELFLEQWQLDFLYKQISGLDVIDKISGLAVDNIRSYCEYMHSDNTAVALLVNQLCRAANKQ